MTTKKQKQTPPPFGWISEIARIVGCDRNTVRTAIYNGKKGVKAEKARQVYAAKYGNI